jgi:hypothetical protein
MHKMKSNITKKITSGEKNMETLQIQVHVEENLAKAYKKSPIQLKDQLRQYLHSWLKQHLSKEMESEKKDPWVEFLDKIDEYAVDTGIPDLSYQHDHYLYGVPKK